MQLSLIGTIFLLPLVVLTTEIHDMYDEDGWQRAGEHLMKYMDSSKEPCDEFFGHVCGKFGDGAETYESDFQRQFVLRRKAMMKTINDLALNCSQVEDKRISALVQKIFHQCIDSQGDVNVTDSLKAAINETVQKLFEDQSRDQDSGNGSSAQNRWRVLGRMSREVGLIGEEWMGFMLAVKTIYNVTYLVLTPPVKYMTEKGEGNVTASTIDQLQSVVPSVDWKAYFDELFHDEFANDVHNNTGEIMVLVAHADALDVSGREINGLTSDQLTENVTRVVTSVLTNHIESLIVEGWSAESLCAGILIQRQPTAMALLYLESISTSPLALRNDIITMYRNIVSAFRFLLNSADWLDAGDKEKVQRKIDHVKFYPGIPSWIEDDAKVMEDMNRYTYDEHLSPVWNEIASRRKDHQKQLRRVIDQRPAEEQDSVNFEPNSDYNRAENKIRIWFGMSGPPMFDIHYPLAVKYGGLGFMIGHELLHAFDADGVKSPYPKDEDWLSKAVLEQFDRHRDCLIRYYSKQCLKDKAYCVSGRNNIRENMADVDGLKTAYVAFKAVIQVFGEDPPIPTMLNYTQDQLFFLATGRNWCSSGWDDLFRTDPHTIDKIRVETMIQNVPLFARAFDCKVGSKYAPMKVCSVWGDLANPARKVAVPG